jgi:Glycosyl transferases group 1
MRVLHVLPDSAVAPSQRYLGSTKDIRGRTEYLQTTGISYDEVAIVRRDGALRAALEPLPLDRYDVVLVELALYPRSLKWLRQSVPKALQVVRPTNASSLQQLHLARLAVALSERRATGWRQGGLELLRAARRLQKEVGCARGADWILPITQWERTNYWEHFTSREKVLTVPYFLPREYGGASIGTRPKRTDCVCLTSSSISPFSIDALRNFERLVGQLAGRCPGWRFVVTGALEEPSVVEGDRIIRSGFVGDLDALLGGARAIALLSDYGFGFKTKVLDAVRCECFVLVTAPVYHRMPMEARPFCIIVDPKSVDSFAQALDRCLAPYPSGNPNEIFRRQAFDALDSVLQRR